MSRVTEDGYRTLVPALVAPLLVIAAVVIVFHGALNGEFVNWDDNY